MDSEQINFDYSRNNFLLYFFPFYDKNINKLFQKFVLFCLSVIFFLFTLYNPSAAEINDIPTDLTRGELISKLVNSKFSEKEIRRCNKFYFEDVNSGNEYFNVLCVAKEKGFVNGFNDGNFYPQRLINTEDILNLTYKVLGNGSESYETFWNERKLLPNTFLCNDNYI